MSAATIEPVIRFDNVHIGFDGLEVLHGVSFEVKHRETKVLIGETGAGKSLILKLAAGLWKPARGRVVVLGRDFGPMSEVELLDFRRQIGFVFQEGALFDSLSVSENVAYRLQEDRVGVEETEQRVREALRFVELEQAMDMLPDELSGGMRRRVSIARALVSRPSIMLFDSPTAGLDPVTSQTIITLILRLRDLQGVTSILATHRLQDALALANYRFDIAQNKVVKAYPEPPPAVPSSNGQPSTNLLVLRAGRPYFEGGQRAFLDSSDEYLKRYLV